jgi:hypothetical protein
VFLEVQALAQSISPDLGGGVVVDGILVSVVVEIADIHAAHQWLCDGRSITPIESIESDKQIGVRTCLAPHGVEPGDAEVTPDTPTGMVRLTVPDSQFADTPPFQ